MSFVARRARAGRGVEAGALAMAVVALGACGARGDLLGETDGAGGGDLGSGASGAAGTGTGTSDQGTGGAGARGTGTASGTGTAGAGGASGTGTGTGAGGSAGGTGTGTAGSGGTGTGTTTGTGTGGEVCPGFGDPCTECMSIACPDVYCACVESSECVELLQCTPPCDGDPECVQGCFTEHEGGIADAYLLADCAATQCDPSCAGGGQELEPCGECIFQSCEDEVNTCFADPTCLALYDCLDGCKPLELSCQQACYASFGEGVPELEALLACSAQSCQPECGT